MHNDLTSVSSCPASARKAFGQNRILTACAAAVLIAAGLVSAACSRSTPSTDQASTKTADQSKPASTANTTTPAAAPVSSTPAAKPAPTPLPAATTPAAPVVVTSTENFPQVRLTTSMGDIVLELNREKAPISVANFLSYVDKGFYNGTTFHRVISGFMIQGGGFTPDMKQKPTDPPIKNEWQNGLKNEAYTLAMARTSVPNSATSQFFINSVSNPFLDRPNGGAAYAVFGKVVSGQDVVDKIRAVKTGEKGGMPDVPLEPVMIVKAVREPGK